MKQPLRQILAEARTLLADAGAQGLEGLDVGPHSLRAPAPEAAPARAAASAPASLPAAAPQAGRAAARGPAIAGAPAPAPAARPFAEPAAGQGAPTGAEHLAARRRPEPSREESQAALDAVRAELGPCSRCALAQSRRSIVFGTGRANARLVFVGEGPGRDEDAQGEPFVGEAGKLLGRMLVAMKLQRADVYIANVIKCRPPNNRFPEPSEQAACSPFLWQQLASISPQVVVALGRLASHTLLGGKTPMGKLRGHWHGIVPPTAPPALHARLQGLQVMPTFHPAYLLRRPEDKILVWRDLQAVMARLAELA